MSILGVLRLPTRTPGRGDATYSTWRLKDAHPANPLTRAGHVDADAAWERITWFLDRPDVSAKYSVRITADKARYPILLSNGNPERRGDLDDGRHFATWVQKSSSTPWPFARVSP